MNKMKRIDFENGSVTGNILGATLPMLVAQILNLLYNIVDRVYIARIPKVGTAALGAVGLCFPIIVIITAFSNLFGTGGAPLFSIYRGKKQENTAVQIMDTSFSMLCICGVFPSRIRFRIAGVSIISSQAAALPWPPALRTSCCDSTARSVIESCIRICGCLSSGKTPTIRSMLSIAELV